VGTCLRLEGERALFTRPEFGRDIISYDLITPHAARGVFDAIYWRPGMTWVIDTIRILQPIRRECIEDGGRRMLMLRDVCYHIEAHFELAAHEPVEAAARHTAMFKRAMRAAPNPYLGRANCRGTATLVDGAAALQASEAAQGTVDHGWLFYGVDFAGDRRPRFFRASAVGGLVRVPAPDSPLLFG
jgi:CRISPR-associated protein Cas5d